MMVMSQHTLGPAYRPSITHICYRSTSFTPHNTPEVVQSSGKGRERQTYSLGYKTVSSAAPCEPKHANLVCALSDPALLRCPARHPHPAHGSSRYVVSLPAGFILILIFQLSHFLLDYRQLLGIYKNWIFLENRSSQMFYSNCSKRVNSSQKTLINM